MHKPDSTVWNLSFFYYFVTDREILLAFFLEMPYSKGVYICLMWSRIPDRRSMCLLWIREHSLICLLAAAAVFTVLWLFLQRKRLNIRIPSILILSVLHVILGVLCVKLFAALENFRMGDFQRMSLFGAVFGLPLFYWIGAKLTNRKVSDIFDVFVVPTVFTLACARVNCLLSGCCLGRIISGTEHRWPTREAELVFYAILLPILIVSGKKRNTEGTLWPIYMAAYGAFRFFIEFFRESAANTLFHLSHIWAMVCFLIGLSVLLEIKLRRNRASNESHSIHRKKRS